MADEPNKTAEKRRVRNPETFRERAKKATEGKEQAVASRTRRSPKNFLARIFGPIFKPIGHGIADFFRLPGIRLLRYPAKILAKILFVSYFVDSWHELQLVTWPGWKESRRLTYAVLVFAVIFGSAVAGVDWGLGKIFKHILLNK
jgi:preprotein translocase SecE subunit